MLQEIFFLFVFDGLSMYSVISIDKGYQMFAAT